MTAVDSFGCSNDTVFSGIQVYPVPIADFEVQLVDSCGLPQEVCFTNLSTGAQGFDWVINGISSSENNPCLMFDQAGTFDVQLIAQNSFLCSDTISKRFTVYDEPTAEFTAEITEECDGFQFDFENISTNADFAIWSYGDGSIDTTWNGSHVYADTGTFVVTLTVGNNSGCTDSFVLMDSIKVNPNPVAGIIYDKLDNDPPCSFEFLDDSSDDVIDYFWDMDDGTTYAQEDVIHRYLSRFDKNVFHIVSNIYDCADTASVTIALDLKTGLFIPNILEPTNNTDPEKQIFLPKGIGLEEYHIAVYARNGELVWESIALDIEGIPTEFWDGTFANTALPNGVYVWKIHKARFLDGTIWDGMKDQSGKERKNGFLHLIR